MKKQFVNGYGREEKLKERLILAGLAGVCIVVFVITVAVSGLIMRDSDSDTKADARIEEDVEVVEAEAEKQPDAIKEENGHIDEVREASSDKAVTFEPPCDGALLTEFSDSMPVYSETLDDWRLHEAIDISAPLGAEVRVVADGAIKEAYNDFRHGFTIVAEHDGGIESIYSNLSGTGMVEIGAKVKKGQQISTIGDSTLFETVADTHLHFEMKLNGAYVNPLNYFALTQTAN